MKRGELFVVSAPSGTGKTTLLRRVMTNVDGLAFSVSHTTRSPRQGEQDGVEYNFVSRDHFLEMVEKGQFLEYAEVHGNLYGTSSVAIEAQLQQGIDVILDIDVQGAEILRKLGKPSAKFIFVAPPDLEALDSRLRGRGTENEESIAVRLKNARVEMRAVSRYDYLIINDILEEAEKVLAAVILAERARARRLPSGKPIDNSVFA
ncbi:MAG: guanylate kinase [Desulforhopalus sp.]